VAEGAEAMTQGVVETQIARHKKGKGGCLQSVLQMKRREMCWDRVQAMSDENRRRVLEAGIPTALARGWFSACAILVIRSTRRARGGL